MGINNIPKDINLNKRITESNNTKSLIWLGLGATALFLFVPKIVRASELSEDRMSEEVPFVGTFQEQTITLVPITGANWTVPLYMTLERDIRFGQWDTLVNIGSGIASGLGTAATAVGNALGTAFTWGSNVLQGTVIPAVINVGGTTAKVITTGAKAVWSGVSTAAQWTYEGVGKIAGKTYDAFKWAGKEVWDVTKTISSKTWNAVVGTAKWVAKTPEVLKASLAIVTAAGAAAFAKKPGDISNATTNPQNTTTNVMNGILADESIQLGYLSKSNFDGALVLVKLFNPALKDTLLMTEKEGIDVAMQAGYQQIGNLGYVAPIPFQYCTPLIRFFNPNTADHLVVSNPEILDQLASIGYQSQGCIGYIKALS